ncbi:MAG: Uncharacterized protein MOP51_2561 [Citricoccus sp.]|jgi:hypothetical protein|nr:Uncharacterized protein [Citricoccus sp. WCRC_4]
MAEPMPGDIRPLLEQMGRASTPPVNTTSYHVELVSIAGYDRVVPSDLGESSDPVLVVGSRDLLRRVRRHHPLVIAAPGMTAVQQEAHGRLRTVIDAAAFVNGPWSSTGTGPRRHLASELKELVQANHTAKVTTYVIPDVPGRDRPPGVRDLVDKFTFTITPTTGDPDTEGSPRSLLLETLIDYANREDED